MSDSVREAFENNENRDDLEFDSYESGYIDATAAADAEWRGVVEALHSAELFFRGFDASCGESKIPSPPLNVVRAQIRKALAQAQQLLERK